MVLKDSTNGSKQTSKYESNNTEMVLNDGIPILTENDILLNDNSTLFMPMIMLDKTSCFLFIIGSIVMGHWITFMASYID